MITARCDAVNDKIRTYNYLPVVHFDDWMQRDGALILAEKAAADTKNSMKNVLKTVSLSRTILDSEEPRRILEVAFLASSLFGVGRNDPIWSSSSVSLFG